MIDLFELFLCLLSLDVLGIPTFEVFPIVLMAVTDLFRFAPFEVFLFRNADLGLLCTIDFDILEDRFTICSTILNLLEVELYYLEILFRLVRGLLMY